MRVYSNKSKKVRFLTAFMLITFLVVFGCGGGGGGDNTSTPAAVNTIPTAADMTVTVDEGSAVSANLSAADADGDTLTFSIVTQPSKGTVSISDVNTGAFTYTSTAGQNGSDSFTFIVSDGTDDSIAGTVSITITPAAQQPAASPANVAPVATNSAVTVDEDSSVNGTLSASDSEGDTLTYSVVGNPTLGAVVITNSATGAFTYTPNANQNGTDSFTFKASDGEDDSNTATVTVTVNAVNDTPSATAPGNFSANEYSTVSLVGNGSDIEDGVGVGYNWSQTAGSVTVTLLNADAATAQFEAPAVETGASVTLTFKLIVTDSGSLTAEDTVEVTINSVGHIMGSSSSPDYHTNLTQTGTLDWAAWGILTDNSFTSKDGGTDGLSSYTEIGDVTPFRSEGNPVFFTWTDGTPHLSADQTRTRIRFADAVVGEGIRLSVPAGVEDQILKVYLGAYSHKGKVTVRLAGDPSVAPYTVSLDNPNSTQETWVITVLFGAAIDGEQLEFDFVVEEDTGADVGGHINLAASVLMPAQAMTPTLSPLPGTYTDPLSIVLATEPSTAAIRYTRDGTAPTSTASLYTGSISVTEDQTINAKAFYPGINNSATVSGSYIIDTTTTGTLSANAAPAPYHTDLTQEGTLDWAAWGLLTADSFTSKDGGSDDLIDFTDIGTITNVRSEGNPVGFTWSDGTPLAHNVAVQTRTRVIFSNTDEDEGIQLTIPANDVEKTLKVYLGSYSMDGKVTVYMEDGSTPVYNTTLSNPNEVQEAWVVTVDFAVPQGSTSNLIFEYVRGTDQGVADGHINIAAATLADQ
ncbi:MAG: Ig-like domain-containing protein [Pseudomonadota bacterium]